ERGRGQSAEQVSEREQMLALNQLAAKFFEDRLQKVESAREYLLGRGLAVETIRQFRLGFAPNDWEGLVSYLQAQKQSLKMAAEAGLLSANQTGGDFDMVRDRIIFP